MESGIRFMLAPRSARAKHSSNSGKSHDRSLRGAEAGTGDCPAGREVEALTISYSIQQQSGATPEVEELVTHFSE
ncbi:hypothetical protein Tco_1522659 [Tanacetum coccineum]|uniref:Uncharacterized protein n=1 Tax=Tanacetum coccineum TaxID=301880 RepID=A0ABQ5CU74_9ASTR